MRIAKTLNANDGTRELIVARHAFRRKPNGAASICYSFRKLRQMLAFPPADGYHTPD
jgi:hypothetical protein